MRYLAHAILALILPVAAEAELRLRLEPVTAPVAVGEPLSVNLTLSNAGEHTVRVKQYLEPEYDFVQYFFQSGGVIHAFSPLLRKEVFSQYALQDLPSGGAIHATAKIYFGSHGWTFAKGGLYSLQALYDGHVWSNKIQILVATPPAHEFALMRNFLETPEVGRYFTLGGGDHLHAGISALEAAAKQFPNSVYGRHANLALAKNLLRSQTDYKTGVVRKMDLPGAVARLRSEVARHAGKNDDIARESRALLERIASGKFSQSPKSSTLNPVVTHR